MAKKENNLISKEIIRNQIQIYLAEQTEQDDKINKSISDGSIQVIDSTSHHSNLHARKKKEIDGNSIIMRYKLHLRSTVLKKKKKSVIDEATYNAIGKYLSAETNSKSTISYHAFKRLANEVPLNMKKYFKANIFMLFPCNQNSEIRCEDFLRYLERSMEIQNTILELMECASNIDDPYSSSITEQQLEDYILSLIPEMDISHSLHESFYPFYVYTASQKFLFFLDQHKKNLISVKKLAHSAIMEELLYLRRLARIETEMDPNDFEIQTNANWFNGSNALRIYTKFLDLDRDENGMLKIDEIIQFTGFIPEDEYQFTSIAYERLFEEYITFQPFEMDYKAFVNFILALENATSDQSIYYFWRILDYDKSGFLTKLKIKYFYKEIYKALIALNYEAPSEDEIVLEIFDILGCNNGEQGVSLDELMKSKQGNIIMQMLLDVNGLTSCRVLSNSSTKIELVDSKSIVWMIGSISCFTVY
eukprot:gene4217-5993_t